MQIIIIAIMEENQLDPQLGNIIIFMTKLECIAKKVIYFNFTIMNEG